MGLVIRRLAYTALVCLASAQPLAQTGQKCLPARDIRW